MKKFWLVLLVMGLVSTGCSKDDSAENGSGKDELPDLPALPDPDDVCSAMDDICFLSYCYTNFDSDQNGKVSVAEADAVREMRIFLSWGTVGSLDGIEYFPNLEILDCEIASVEEVDYGAVLRYNRKLKYLAIDDRRSLSVLDLSRLPELEYLSVNEVGTLSLPASIRELALWDGVNVLKCPAVAPPALFYKNKVSTVYVPEDRVAVYRATAPWSQFDIRPL